MKNTQTAVQTQKAEVRSQFNDKVILAFEHTETPGVNVITAGYNKVCKAFGIDRINAENRYYVTNA